MEPAYLKIFGVERTCTNYVEQLAKLNSDYTVLTKTQFGFKHGFIDPESWIMSGNQQFREFYEMNRAKVFICVKDPYHWLESIIDYCNLPTYIPYNPQRLLRRYNDLYLHWHSELIERTHPFFYSTKIIRYEEVLKSPSETLGFNVRRNPDKVEHNKRFNSQRKRHYLTKVKDEDIIKLVNEYVSDDFFIKYGYEHL